MIAARVLGSLSLGAGLVVWPVAMASGASDREAAAPTKEIRIGVEASSAQGRLLGEVLVQLARHSGSTAVPSAGGEDPWELLSRGEIDAYVENGPALDRLRAEGGSRETDLGDSVARHAVATTGRLGFDSGLGLAMKETLAQALDVRTISDLGLHPALRFGLDGEFLDRAAGWDGLAEAYGLAGADVFVGEDLPHADVYSLLDEGGIDVAGVYRTDAAIRALDLRVLTDDREYLPRSEAVILYRVELERTAPRFVELVRGLEGRLDDAEMALWNGEVETLEARVGSGLGLEPSGAGEIERARGSRYRSIGPKIVARRLLASELGLEPPVVMVGSKKFTEGVILGELVALCARFAGAEAIHRKELGGTQILWNALLRGDIDAYVEYTGTLRQEILAQRRLGEGLGGIREELAKVGLLLSNPLGFDNTYALGMRRSHAQRLGIEGISDLERHRELRLGFSNEFLQRQDGWPGLRDRYGLTHRDVAGMDHDLAYKGIESGRIDVTDLYSTDAKILEYDLETLTDDASFFPEYEAVIVYRADLVRRAPLTVDAMLLLEGTVSEQDIIRMNAAVERAGGAGGEAAVAAGFLRRKLAIEVASAVRDSRLHRLAKHTLQHLVLVGVSLSAAVVVAFFLGIFAARSPLAGPPIMGAVGIVQTIPSLALLVFMVPLVGIGRVPAIIALFVYSLLPIVESTHAGLESISPEVRESAAALGLGSRATLWRIEIPLASRSILAGIRTSAVINVGTATLGGIIGAGGYGELIMQGIRTGDAGLILEGAVPAALLALLVRGGLQLSDRVLVPKGLRLPAETTGG